MNIEEDFGVLIGHNNGHVPTLKKAVMVLWEQRTMNTSAVANGVLERNGMAVTLIRPPPPFHVMKAIKPVFETLSDESLLQKSAHGGTQSTNESFFFFIS